MHRCDLAANAITGMEGSPCIDVTLQRMPSPASNESFITSAFSGSFSVEWGRQHFSARFSIEWKLPRGMGASAFQWKHQL